MRHSIWLLAVVLLSGCGLFARDTPIEVPAELVEFDASLDLQRVWTANVAGQGDRRLGLRPATDGTWVFAGGSAGRVLAVDAASGQVQWQANTGLQLSAGPTYGQGLLVFGTLGGELVALDAQTGEQRWIRRVGGEVLSAPAVSPQAVAVRTVDGRLVTLSPQDGTELWSLDQNVPLLSIRGTSSPAIAAQRVIAGFDNGRLGAYALANGDTIWEILLSPPSGRTEISRLIDINGTPIVQGNVLYVANFNGVVAAVDLTTGRIIWNRPFSTHLGLTLRGSALIGVDRASEIVSIASGTGNSLWVNDRMRMRDLSQPALLGASVVVGDFQGYLHWLDGTNGEFQARVRVGNGRVVGLLAVGDVLIAQTDRGSLTAWTVRSED